MSNPWFRLCSRIMNDPVIEFLSFEDQRHFIWILCLKNDGFIDKKYPNPERLDRVMARKLGLSGAAFDNAKMRLIEVDLIDENWQPKNWNDLQFISDQDSTRTERQRWYRERNSSKSDSNGKVTPLDTEQINTHAHAPPAVSAFDRFWQAYPKKKSKGHAEKAFKKINPSEQLLATMIASIEQAKTSRQWQEQGGQFIPYPATWLNARGWEDEIDIHSTAMPARMSKLQRAGQAFSDFHKQILQKGDCND